MNQTESGAMRGAPAITHFRVIPVAGHDGMLMNLSGAHGPFFTRNIVILTDSSGRTGVGEVPGGEKFAKPCKTPRHSSWVSRLAITTPS
jgi:glucarate dehydratase